MESLLNTKVKVGNRISQGLYHDNKSVYASLTGTLTKKQLNTYCVMNNIQFKSIGPQIGSIVYARVLKIKQDEVLTQILQIGTQSTSMPLQATIRRQYVREKLIDQVVMHQCYKPNDIIRAKVISLGDSLRTLYLTTAHESLGVVVACSEISQKIMLPYDWTSMIDVASGERQNRKVAKPQL